MLLISGTDRLAGAIDGRNTVFVADTAVPAYAVISINGLSRAPGVVTSNGYVLSGRQVLLAEPLVPGDILTVYIPPTTAQPLTVQPGGVRPEPGSAVALRPSGGAAAQMGSLYGAAYALRPSIGASPTKAGPGLTGVAERT